jgi:putative flippase GtrA
MAFTPKALYLLALTTATIISGVESYITQRKFVWKSSANTRTEFMKFFLVLLSQFVLNSLLLFICVEYFGLDPLRTQYVIGSILIVSTYFAHRHWTFHPDSRNDEDA